MVRALRLPASVAPRALAALLALLVSPLSGCITVNLLGEGAGAMRETVVFGERGPKIALIEIDGLITDRTEENAFGLEEESSVARLREQLQLARKDDDVRALLLRIDTPGGTATGSEMCYREILRFKQERRVPVLAQLMGTATSGGYYVAMAADRVVAHPTTVTGSIGVIFLGVEISGLMEKLGIGNQTITAGAHKDAGSPLRPMTASERAHLQSVIDDLFDQFRHVVDEGRPGLTREQVDQLADGSLYSAEQARAAGLVDDIGSLEDSIEMLRARTGFDEMRVVRYRRPREWRRSIYDRAPAGPPVLNVDLGGWLGPLRHPGFHYLWWPGAQ